MQLFAVGLKGPGGGDVRVISLDGVEVVGKVRLGRISKHSSSSARLSLHL
jgi:hypothetical protein